MTTAMFNKGTGNSGAPAPKANMGQPAQRIDGALKVTGQASYVSDVDAKNSGYAYLVTSAIAKGSIAAIDDAEARAVDGVLLILTHENTADAVKQVKFSKGGGPASTSIVPLSSPKIWHDGQIVAVVVADRFEAASEAAHRLKIRYASEPPTAGFGSIGTTEVAIQDAHQAEKIEPPKVGDFAKAFAAAAVRIEAEYATPTSTTMRSSCSRRHAGGTARTSRSMSRARPLMASSTELRRS